MVEYAKPRTWESDPVGLLSRMDEEMVLRHVATARLRAVKSPLDALAQEVVTTE